AHEEGAYGVTILEYLHSGSKRFRLHDLTSEAAERTDDRGAHNETTDSGSHDQAPPSLLVLRCGKLRHDARHCTAVADLQVDAENHGPVRRRGLCEKLGQADEATLHDVVKICVC